MDAKLKEELIKEAKIKAIENPRDNYAHDITHLERTAKLALDIANHIDCEVDKDIVEVVAWWHDIDLQVGLGEGERAKDKTAEYLASKFEEHEKEIIYDAIYNHEFGSRPKFTEGKVLFDADKLEIVSAERVINIKNAIKKGILKAEKIRSTIKTVMEEWFPVLPNLLHFDYSKNKFNNELPQAVKSFKEI
jgi:HD superfamily phosphohydrolase YqeK